MYSLDNCLIIETTELPDIATQNVTIIFQKSHHSKFFGKKCTSENTEIGFILWKRRTLDSSLDLTTTFLLEIYDLPDTKVVRLQNISLIRGQKKDGDKSFSLNQCYIFLNFLFLFLTIDFSELRK